MKLVIHSQTSTNFNFTLHIINGCNYLSMSCHMPQAIVDITLRLDQNNRQFTNNIFKCISLNDNLTDNESDWLTHWGRATHICARKLTIIGSDNGLSPGRRQAITWTNDGILLIGPLETKFREIWSKIRKFSLKKMHLKSSSVKWRPFYLGLNVLR